MYISFEGYKVWKHIKDELHMYTFEILPSISVQYDTVFESDEYPYEIRISWLFWRMSIYF